MKLLPTSTSNSEIWITQFRCTGHYLKQAYPNPDGRVSRKLADALLRRFEYQEARDILEKVLSDYPVQLADPRFPDLEPRHEPGRSILYRLAESYVEEAEGTL